MDATTIPAEYTAILMSAVALYGGLSFIVVQVLRRIFPIESTAALITSLVISFGLGAWAAVQHALPLLPGLDANAQVLLFLGHMGGAWWVSQELYRRLRADTWGTKADPSPKPRS